MIPSSVYYLAAVGMVFIAATILGWVAFNFFRQSMDRYRATFTETARANMADMFLFVDVGQLFYINLGALIVLPSFTWLLTGDLLTAVGLFVTLLVIPPYVYRRMRKARLKRIENQLPDGLTMIAAGLRAGASTQIAIQALVKEQPPPLSQEFELFMREQRIGTDFDTALDHMEQRLPIPDFHMVASAMRISREVGGNLAETLETLADTLRRKSMMEGKIDSLTAQGRMQAIVMAALPFFLMFVLSFMEPEAMSKLYTTPIGWSVLGFIVVWVGLGFMFIRKIVSIDV